MTQPLQPNAIGSIVPLLTGTGGGGGGGILAGDAVGPLLANTVVAIQNNPVTAGVPAVGDMFVWDGAAWTPTPGLSGGVSSAPGAWTVPAGAVVGDVIYASGAFVGALADASANATTPGIGVITAKPTAVTATVLYYGETPVGTYAGLAVGSEYFLSLVAGGIIVEGSAPTGTGEVLQRLGVAISLTQLLLMPDPTKVIL